MKGGRGDQIDPTPPGKTTFKKPSLIRVKANQSQKRGKKCSLNNYGKKCIWAKGIDISLKDENFLKPFQIPTF